MKSNSIYHTATKESKHKILSEGLDASANQQTTLAENEIAKNSEFYYYPESSTQSKIDYAYSLILTILEQKRPKSYPKHHSCQFFFPTQDLIGELNRPVVFKIDTSVLETHQIYEANFSLAEKLFFKTIQNFEIGDEIKIDTLQQKAENYWESTNQIQNTQQASPFSEIFSPVQLIPPEYISEM